MIPVAHRDRIRKKALIFVESEREFGGDAFLGIPAWALESVMPFAFAVIALRYAWGIVPLVAVALGLRAPEAEEPIA